MRDALSRIASPTVRAGFGCISLALEPRFKAATYRLVLVALATLTTLLLFTSSARAAFSHSTSDAPFPVGAPCTAVVDIAVLEPEGYVYVGCEAGGFGGEDVIKRFDLVGNPVPFTASVPWVSGNEITADPGSTTGELEFPKLAVDSNPTSSNHGFLYVTSSPNIDIFNVDGSFAGAIKQDIENSAPNFLAGVDVGDDGSIYVTSEGPGDRISRYDTSLEEIQRLYASYGYEDPWGNPEHIAIDSTGAAWQAHAGLLTKFEADQFTEELEIPSFLPPRDQLEQWKATPSPFADNPLLSSEFGNFAVDRSDDDLYVDRGNRIEIYSAGNAEENSFRNAPAFGSGKLTNSRALEITADHHVYASTESNKIVRFGPGAILPDVRTHKPAIAEVGHTDATVRGTIELAGGGPIIDCKVKYGNNVNSNGEYSGPNSGTVSCSPDPTGGNFTQDTEVSAHLTSLPTGTPIHYTFVGTNAAGSNQGIDRVVTPAYVLQVQTLSAANVDTSGAGLRGTLDPDGAATSYHFEYGVTSSYGLNTPTVSAGSAAGVQTVEQLVDDLPSGKTLHYRIVATTGPNSTYGEDRTVRIASAPDISSTGSRERTASSAVLTAAINPVGYDTNYHFEYGATSNLGQSAPASPVDIGDGTDPVPVSQPISGLSPGVTYHFRVIAENKWGTAMSEDTTFEFLPSSCPNDLVRQQTRASFLPDCRAYELVSPPAAGAVNLWPGNEVFDLCNSDECNWPVNRGFSVGQPRFGYFGGLGAISGLDPATGLTDLYMASRTDEGWVTIVPTLKSSQAFLTKGKQCSIALDVCIDHVRGEAGFVGEEAPYAFDAQGNGIGQLPTNVDSVTNGSQFRGDQRLSDDGTHFVFSSGEAPNVFGELIEPPVFAPGGKNSGLGSAYDNDIAAGTVTLISRLPKGSNPGEPEEEPHLPEEKPVHEAIRLPGVSKDASHILMQIPAAGSGTHLFMRVNDAVTYDISKGGEVNKTIGMTTDGSVVYFTSADQLLPADTDSGVDLYRWNESSPSPDSLQLISQGNGQGNATDCVAPFEGCSIRPLSPQREHPFQNQLVAVPGQDDVMAEGSGDVYFFSPESLDPDHPGIKNEPNLYLYRDGTVQLVTTFDPGTDINRMQISTDGSHAAMVTKSQLTSQNINGTEQMYTYDANTGVIRCASCDPRGRTPLRSVKASQNGRFMADDGRTFFSTEEALVPEDGNGTIIDTYEYVGGRPQLISSGQGSRDFTGGSELVSLAAKAEFIGLEHVSRDGVDVFFSTYETLVPRDNNGRFVKLYDARTAGGFLDRVDLGPCAAADECHGSDTAPPASPVVTTATNMGDGGNVHRARKHKKKHRKKRRRSAGHRRGQHHGHPAGKSAASNQQGGRRG